MEERITVAALNRYVKSVLESDDALRDIAIEGEISNFNRHYKSGHCYFTLKDDKAGVKAVMFRSDAERLAFEPEDGMAVIVRCRVSLYERDGAFQIYVQHIFPHGVGAAQVAFEQLKRRLTQEGLFLEELKKPLPEYPGRVGLVTSRNGAALQDILKVAARRCPLARFLLAPVSVQGQQAVEQVVEGIRALDESGAVDVIVVARGGGSAEDLWVFNAEEVARAAFGCKTPVVSAIGHEVDFTILDFAADVRAPTPSAAAEVVLPDMAAKARNMMDIYRNTTNNIQKKLESWYTVWKRCAADPALRAAAGYPLQQAQWLADLQQRITASQALKLKESGGRLAAGAQLAAGLNPYGVLARGYGMVRSGGKSVRGVGGLALGDGIEVQMQDGEMACRVETIALKDGMAHE